MTIGQPQGLQGGMAGYGGDRFSTFGANPLAAANPGFGQPQYIMQRQALQQPPAPQQPSIMGSLAGAQAASMPGGSPAMNLPNITNSMAPTDDPTNSAYYQQGGSGWSPNPSTLPGGSVAASQMLSTGNTLGAASASPLAGMQAGKPTPMTDSVQTMMGKGAIQPWTPNAVQSIYSPTGWSLPDGSIVAPQGQSPFQAQAGYEMPAIWGQANMPNIQAQNSVAPYMQQFQQALNSGMTAAQPGMFDAANYAANGADPTQMAQRYGAPQQSQASSQSQMPPQIMQLLQLLGGGGGMQQQQMPQQNYMSQRPSFNSGYGMPQMGGSSFSQMGGGYNPSQMYSNSAFGVPQMQQQSQGMNPQMLMALLGGGGPSQMMQQPGGMASYGYGMY